MDESMFELGGDVPWRPCSSSSSAPVETWDWSVDGLVVAKAVHQTDKLV